MNILEELKNKFNNKQITNKLNDYLHIPNRLSRVGIDMWLITKEQGTPLTIFCCNSYKNKINNDNDLCLIKLNEYSISKTNYARLNMETLRLVEEFILTNKETITDYYQQNINRTDVLSKL